MSGKSPPVKADPCPVCNLVVKTPSLDCDVCHRWFHLPCVKLTTKDLQVLNKSGVNFFCKDCSPKIKELISNIDKLQETLDYVKSLEQRVANLESSKQEPDANSSSEEKIVGVEERLKKLETKVESPQPVSVDNSVSGSQLRDLEDRLKKLENGEDLERFKEKMYQHTKTLSRNNMRLECEIDSQEQYERRDCIVVHNVRERGSGENLHHFAISLVQATGGNISPAEVSVAHRLGRPTNGKPRPVIIKFTRRCVKTVLMRHKYKLRSVRGWENVFVEESLTPWRKGVISELKKIEELTRVSTVDGKILFTKEGKRYDINSGDDFIDILDSGLLPDRFFSAVGINPSLAYTATED